jgi:hypothetical protein
MNQNTGICFSRNALKEEAIKCQKAIIRTYRQSYNHSDIFPLNRKEDSDTANCHTYEEVKLVYISFLK